MRHSTRFAKNKHYGPDGRPTPSLFAPGEFALFVVKACVA